MKFQYTCVFLLALFAASQAYSASWGKRNGTDFIVLRQTEVRQPLKNNYWNINVNYNGQYFITFINVIDNFRNSSGAAPSIYSGGVGYRNTVVTLKSQVSRGLNSTVEIWARR